MGVGLCLGYGCVYDTDWRATLAGAYSTNLTSSENKAKHGTCVTLVLRTALCSVAPDGRGQDYVPAWRATTQGEGGMTVHGER